MSDSLRWMVLGVALAGCVPKLGDQTPRAVALSLPAGWPAEGAGESVAQQGWSAFFGDPELVALVESAVTHNQELASQMLEARISEAEFLARRGEVLPRVGVTAGAGLERVGRFTSQGASDADDEIEPGRTVPEDLGDLSVGLAASWEIDIWKRLRNASRAAQLRTLASVEGRRFAVTGVVAEVAEGYYELLALDEQLKVIDANVAILRDALEIARLQKEAARSTELAVQRFEADLLQSEAERQQILLEIASTEIHLNAVAGRFPGPIPRRAGALDEPAGAVVGLGTPAELLERRPDVRAAELGLQAAQLDVKAARAAFYPSLGLEMGVGLDAFSLARLPTPESLAYGVAGGLLSPLLNRSAQRSAYLAANARQSQAVLAYEQTLVRAYAEVATAQAQLNLLRDGHAHRRDQVAVLQSAVETCTGLFGRARLEYLEVLTTRRDALEAEMARIDVALSVLKARVGLYEALGGGWRDDPSLPSEPMSPASPATEETR